MQRFQGRARNLSTDGSAVVESLDDGRIFFVEGAWPGDEGVFEVISFEKRFGYARLIELQKKSDERVEVRCPHQSSQADDLGIGKCGGCPWMIGSYASQLKHKAHRLEYALQRAGLLGGNHVDKVSEILASENEFGYRNRAQFKTNGIQLGFVEGSSNRIVDVSSCEVLNSKMKENLGYLREQLPRVEWKPTGKHHWNFIDLDDDIDLRALAQVPLNKRRPFKQGNSLQNEKMRGWLRTKLSRPQKVLELFCGSGNFTEILSGSPDSRILAVEIAQVALDELRLKAQKWSSSSKLSTMAFDLSSPRDFKNFLRQLKTKGPIDYELLFLDPPREGAKGVELLVEEMKNLKSILMISCDVATFTRDASAIAKKGFVLKEVQPLDLFPQTAHVEVMAEFVVKNC